MGLELGQADHWTTLLHPIAVHLAPRDRCVPRRLEEHRRGTAESETGVMRRSANDVAEERDRCVCVCVCVLRNEE